MLKLRRYQLSAAAAMAASAPAAPGRVVELDSGEAASDGEAVASTFTNQGRQPLALRGSLISGDSWGHFRDMGLAPADWGGYWGRPVSTRAARRRFPGRHGHTVRQGQRMAQKRRNRARG